MHSSIADATPMNLKLYYSPKACSLASHIALELSGLPYDAISVNIRTGENIQPDYLKISPQGMVPALQSGGVAITESQAILTYVADLVPEIDLLPRPGTRNRAKSHEWMNWISSSLHAAFRSIFRPEIYAGNHQQAIAAVRRHSNAKLAKFLAEVEERLGESNYAVGPAVTVVDAYLFVFYLWSFDERIEAELPERRRYAALAARLWELDSVRKVVARERMVRAYDLPPEFTSKFTDVN